jgi:hypothetical protein
VSDLYNVVVPVLAIVRADHDEHAVARLADALEAAGFEVYDPGDGVTAIGVGAFVSADPVDPTPGFE